MADDVKAPEGATEAKAPVKAEEKVPAKVSSSWWLTAADKKAAASG